MGLFHRHRWGFLRLRYYIDTSYDTESKSTQVYYKCSGCGKLRVDNHYGEVFVESDFE